MQRAEEPGCTLRPTLNKKHLKLMMFHFFPVTDQCHYNNGGCSQLCLLSPFGRKCSCSDGLDLRDDGQTCHGNTKENYKYVV